ncbi:hypothetical protein ACNKHR_02225 [Shigella flexneri]
MTLSLLIAFALQLFLPGSELDFSPLALFLAFFCSTVTGICSAGYRREMRHDGIPSMLWRESK